ncbi:MAG: glyoxalase [Flavobacteriaceae bacterium]|nr:glyoxalase [Flavobacteriaceae bacterium]
MAKRPVLKNIILKDTLVTENFQNATIRAIIKMQHQTLITLLKDNLTRKKINVSELSSDKLVGVIKTTLKKDNTFKKILHGVIIGQFSDSELNVYIENSSEYNRRILQIITQRYSDSVTEIM